MFDLEKYIKRYYRAGFLILCGLLAIIYGTLGFIYVQQGMKQKNLNEQITQLTTIVSKPLSSIAVLKEESNNITVKLAPIENPEAIDKLVRIAAKHGIDITEGTGNFIVPACTITTEQIGSSNYRVLIFNNVLIQGGYKDVMSFISELESDSGNSSNIVLTKMVVTETIAEATGEEAARIEEFRVVTDAVKAMMDDNQLLYIINPQNAGRGEATNYMGDDPATKYIIEGFPDIKTPRIQKGYTGNATPKDGYVLWEHDKILVEDPSAYTTVSYTDFLRTAYYYTCESNGQVRQWDNPTIALANEYFGTSLSITQLKVVFDVNFYTKN
jgi:hypothetical protein